MNIFSLLAAITEATQDGDRKRLANCKHYVNVAKTISEDKKQILLNMIDVMEQTTI